MFVRKITKKKGTLGLGHEKSVFREAEYTFSSYER